jgi:hypothetical protein
MQDRQLLRELRDFFANEVEAGDEALVVWRDRIDAALAEGSTVVLVDVDCDWPEVFGPFDHDGAREFESSLPDSAACSVQAIFRPDELEGVRAELRAELEED